MELWVTSSATAWESAAASLPVHLAARSGTTKLRAELANDDSFVFEALAGSALSRKPPHLTQPELSRIMRWKLAYGKFRPGLQGYIDKLPPKEVVAASTAAFAALGAGEGAAKRGAKAADEALASALSALCVLKGVGPATASAVLAAVAPARCAYLSDDAIAAALKIASPRYSIEEVVALSAACAEKAAALGGGAWTANGVQRALHAAAAAVKLVTPQAGGGKKRKRA